jgi:hypothetical protein
VEWLGKYNLFVGDCRKIEASLGVLVAALVAKKKYVRIPELLSCLTVEHMRHTPTHTCIHRHTRTRAHHTHGTPTRSRKCNILNRNEAIVWWLESFVDPQFTIPKLTGIGVNESVEFVSTVNMIGTAHLSPLKINTHK